MNNPNPFLPKGSLLEQQGQRRSRLKLAVFCVLAVSVTGLVAMLIQGCKREKPDGNTEVNPPPLDLNTPVAPTNPPPILVPTNPPIGMPPILVPTNPPAPLTTLEPPPVAAGTTKYIVQSGDSFYKISKKFGVSIKAIEAANPGVDSRKLKPKQELNIPAKTGAELSPAPTSVAADTGTVYTVQSNDTLEKLHKKFGVSVKAIQTANHLTTTKIIVGQKLKIPAKTESVPAPGPALTPAPAPAPVDTLAPPAVPTTTTPAPVR